MSDQQLLAIVTAILFHRQDKNPPHGVWESEDAAIKRTLVLAKTIIRAAEQA